MKNKLFNIIFSTLLLSSLLSGQVFANSVVTPTTESATENITYTPIPFMVEGNLTLDDNVTSADDKEFYTVHSKNGNEFFIVVDKANDSNNVYFLNAVDEQDLLSLVDEYQDIYITTETTTITTTETTTEITSAVEEVENVDNKNKEGSILPVIIIVVIVVGIIGFLKLRKKNNPDDDPDDEDEDDSENSNNKETDDTSSNSDSDDNKEINHSFSSGNNNSVFSDDSESSPFSSETNSDYESVEVPDEEDLTDDDKI